MKYFAYGSNMMTPWLHRRIPAAECLGIATLYGFEIRWHKRSDDGSGKCNLLLHDHGPSTNGVLYALTEGSETELDRAEGGYVRGVVQVEIGGLVTPADTYFAHVRYINERLQPHDWYKQLVVACALMHGLPPAYIARLAAQQSWPGGDSEDATEARRILKQH